MHILNNYSLQRRMESKKGLFDKLQNVSIVLKVLFLLSLLTLFRSLWMLFVTGALIVCDIVLSLYRSKLIFTYIYSFSDAVFYVVKKGLDGKETVLEKIPVADIKNLSYDNIEVGCKKYYNESDDFGEDRPLSIRTETGSIAVLSDVYLYSIIQHTLQEIK